MSEKKKGFWSWFGFGKKEEKEREFTGGDVLENSEKNINEEEVLTEQGVVEEIQQAEQSAESDIVEEIQQAEQSAESDIVEEIQRAEQSTESDIVEEIQQAEQSAESDIVEEIQQAEQSTESEIVEEIQQAEQSIESEIVEEIQQEIPLVESEYVENVHQESISEIQAVEIDEEIVKADEYQEKPSKGGFFSRLIQGLVKTKQNIGSGFLGLFRGKKIDDELFEELEEQLLIADLGMPTTTKIINNLTQHASRSELRDAEQLYQKLKEELSSVLTPVSQPLKIDSTKKPYVILMVGVNGVGKTTTIGKLARKFQAEGKSVMLAAGDTFRAAAVEQLQVWGERNNIPVIAQATGADSASVIYDAMQSAAAKGADVLIADTAGRLQNKNHLMDELKKIVRVMRKYDENAPHEIMLTLDAGTGQNAISQAKLFHEAVGLTGITLTKLDGTAKGGVIFAIADQFGLPIRYIGVGEKIEDLREFNATEFIEALFSHEEK